MATFPMKNHCRHASYITPSPSTSPQHNNNTLAHHLLSSCDANDNNNNTNNSIPCHPNFVHITNRGSNEDLYEFLQRDLLSSYSSYSPSMNNNIKSPSPFYIDGYSPIPNLSAPSYPPQHIYVRNRSQESNNSGCYNNNYNYNCIDSKERRSSFNSTLEDAVTINALNPLQKQMSQLLNVNSLNNGKGWQPPNYDVDLEPSYDGHSFLSPKLFHSKKLLDSNIISMNKANKKYKLSKIRKKGPREIGRMKGFKSPKFRDNNNNHNHKNFISKRRNKKKNQQKKNHAHSRWNSNGVCIKPSNLKRKFSTNSLRSYHSNKSIASKYDDNDYDTNSIIINNKKHSLFGALEDDEENDDDEDEDDGMVYVNDYDDDNNNNTNFITTPRRKNKINNKKILKRRTKNITSLKTNTRQNSTLSKYRKNAPKSARLVSTSASKRYWNSNNVDFFRGKIKFNT